MDWEMLRALGYADRSAEDLAGSIRQIADPDRVISFANEEIARFTKSDFTQAWYYEAVKAEAVRQQEAM